LMDTPTLLWNFFVFSKFDHIHGSYSFPQETLHFLIKGAKY